jgi:hypothetical protein
MFSDAIAALYIVCPGHGFSPAEDERIVAVPFVILKNGMQIDRNCIVDLTFIF